MGRSPIPCSVSLHQTIGFFFAFASTVDSCMHVHAKKNLLDPLCDGNM